MKYLARFLIRLGIPLVLLLVSGLVAIHWYQPKVSLTTFPPPTPVSGAAVFYNQAFAAMPKLSEEDEKIVYNKPDQPWDASKATQLLERFDPSLKLIEQGAMEHECEWGLDLNLAPEILCSQTNGLKLVQVLCNVRAHLHLEQGNVQAAVDDLLLSFRFGRQLETPELIINHLIRINTNRVSINFAAVHLSEFDNNSLQKLYQGIIALPHSRPMREAVASERKIWVSYFNNHIAKTVIEATKNIQNAEIPKPIEEIAITRGWPIKLLVYWIKRYEEKSLELEKLMGLPYVEARPQLDAFERNLKRNRWLNGIYASSILPGEIELRRKEVQMESVWTIFLTALNAQIHDPSSVHAELMKLRDPYDNGPLEWKDVPGGIEVKLKAPPDKKTMTLMVELAKK